MDTQKIRTFAEKTAEKRRLAAELETLKAELAFLEQELLELYAEEGVLSQRVETDYGNFNVSPKSQLWASAPDGAGEEGKDYARGCAALRAVGLEGFVQERFNTMTLSAWVREQVKMGRAALEILEDGRLVLRSEVMDLSPLEDGLKISEKFSLSVTKAAKK